MSDVLDEKCSSKKSRLCAEALDPVKTITLKLGMTWIDFTLR
ncbi:hypothetical protein [Desulfosporosinus shakirovi]|nr:hypothetical protein [Desulfosporosinus sp. SRJS8]